MLCLFTLHLSLWLCCVSDDVFLMYLFACVDVLDRWKCVIKQIFFKMLFYPLVIIFACAPAKDRNVFLFLFVCAQYRCNIKPLRAVTSVANCVKRVTGKNKTFKKSLQLKNLDAVCICSEHIMWRILLFVCILQAWACANVDAFNVV